MRNFNIKQQIQEQIHVCLGILNTLIRNFCSYQTIVKIKVQLKFRYLETWQTRNLPNQHPISLRTLLVITKCVSTERQIPPNFRAF